MEAIHSPLGEISQLTGLVRVMGMTPVSGYGRAGLAAVAYGSLFTWAWLELFQGVNYFRRSLGLLVLVGVVILLGLDLQ
jgi:hypothetical protein